jgi:hypothetical protein
MKVFFTHYYPKDSLMKKYSALAFVVAMIGASAYAMDGDSAASAGAPDGAGKELIAAAATAGESTPLSPAEDGQSLAQLAASTPAAQDLQTKSILKQDAEVQAHSNLLYTCTPSGVLKELLNPALGYSFGIGLASSLAGIGAGTAATVAANAVLPARLSGRTRERITALTAVGTYFATAFYTMFKGFGVLDRRLVPGGIPAGAVFKEKIVPYVDKVDGQRKTKTVRYYALPESAEATQPNSAQ